MIGCIADDYTGGTDVASAFRHGGLRTVLVFGRPEPGWQPPECDAIVVALKSRNLPADRAVRVSLDARAWLREHGATQIYFKYCSTFDSTDAGNIGPVADALVVADNASVAVVCPASPEHGRTVYKGHLFVGDRLLSESSLRNHPLTPMTDPDLVRVLSRQTVGGVQLLGYSIVRQGAGSVRAALGFHPARFAVVDAITDEDLHAIAEAVVDAPVVTGAAGLARALGQVRGAALATRATTELPEGPAVILAGSQSQMTTAQIAQARDRYPSLEVSPADAVSDAVTWLETHIGNGPVLVYASRDVVTGGSEAIERTLSALARRAVDWGVKRLVVAGGETSGAVVEALDVGPVVVGEEADRGVPWLVTGDGIALLLKSGNFGRPDLLVRAAS